MRINLRSGFRVYRVNGNRRVGDAQPNQFLRADRQVQPRVPALRTGKAGMFASPFGKAFFASAGDFRFFLRHGRILSGRSGRKVFFVLLPAETRVAFRQQRVVDAVEQLEGTRTGSALFRQAPDSGNGGLRAGEGYGMLTRAEKESRSLPSGWERARGEKNDCTS